VLPPRTGARSRGGLFAPARIQKINAYDVNADIVLHKRMVQDDNPYAFDADALSDCLLNQVAPPK